MDHDVDDLGERVGLAELDSDLGAHPSACEAGDVCVLGRSIVPG